MATLREEMAEIDRIAGSAQGRRFSKTNSARYARETDRANDKFDKALEAEYARHEARLKAIRDGRYAAVQSARHAFEDRERAFFNAALAALQSEA